MTPKSLCLKIVVIYLVVQLLSQQEREVIVAINERCRFQDPACAARIVIWIQSCLFVDNMEGVEGANDGGQKNEDGQE